MLSRQTSSSTRDNSQTPWRAAGRLYLYILYFSLIVQVLLISSGAASAGQLKYVLLYGLLWLVPPLLFPATLRFWVISYGLLFGASSLINLVYFFIYQQDLSQSIFLTLFESNLAEASEYFNAYFHWWMLPAILVYVAVGCWLGNGIRQKIILPATFRFLLLALVTLSFCEPYYKYWPGFNSPGLNQAMHRSSEKLLDRLSTTSPWQLGISLYRYQRELEQVNNLVAQLADHQLQVTLSDKTPRQTYVLVIGESTNRQRMELYGYQRETTPELSAQRKQLAVFNDVITPRPYTIEALSQILSFANQQERDLVFSQANIVSLMKAAGFETWWITNQQTLTQRNTLLTAFSKMSDHQVYLNNNRTQSNGSFDDVVIAPFIKAISASAAKKFIVVHLLGTHLRYDRRYPSDYARFDQQTVNHIPLNAEQQSIYNSYDNAILFNDHVVSSLLTNFQQQNPHGLLLYFSDHGDEVFDEREFYGRSENDPSTSIYTVPLLFWASSSWKKQHNMSDFSVIENRAYSMESFIHSWCDLAAIEYPRCDPHQSLISTAFAEQPRLIVDPFKPSKLISYDAVFEQNHIPTMLAKTNSNTSTE
jgi:heptose-I-phosphate ethanolaminephosphotransferase